MVQPLDHKGRQVREATGARILPKIKKIPHDFHFFGGKKTALQSLSMNAAGSRGGSPLSWRLATISRLARVPSSNGSESITAQCEKDSEQKAAPEDALRSPASKPKDSRAGKCAFKKNNRMNKTERKTAKKYHLNHNRRSLRNVGDHSRQLASQKRKDICLLLLGHFDGCKKDWLHQARLSLQHGSKTSAASSFWNVTSMRAISMKLKPCLLEFETSLVFFAQHTLTSVTEKTTPCKGSPQRGPL